MEQLENLGRYQLLRVLGRGAMGVVYEGIDPKLNRQVAVKTILKSQMLDPGLAAEYTARFMREAQAVARLNHPNIVQVFDFGNEAEVAYIVMEFIRGKELKSYIEEKRLFAIDETVNIVCELLDALEYAHAAGVIHRDIKPANVMLDAASRVKLTDFGVARLSDAGGQEGTRPGTMVGTPGYMSPEQIKGLTVGPQADLFAVGVLLYQCLTLQKPFTGNSDWDIYYKIVHDDPTPASQLRNGIPPHLDKVIQRALAKDPLDRYPSARAMADDLKQVVSNVVFDDEATRLVVDVPKRDRSSDQTLATSASIASGRAGTKFSPQTGTTDAERDFWASIKDSGDIDELESYVAQFPDGLFAKLARIRINKLTGGTVVAESTGMQTIPPMRATQADQEEVRRQAELAARQRAEEERRQAEEAARRQAEETRRAAEQKAAAEAAKRKAAEEAAQRKAAEDAAQRRAAEEAAQRKAVEEAARHRAAEEAAHRKAAEAATARRLAEEAEEARRKAVEEAAKRRALDEEARRIEEASRRASIAMPAGDASADADSTVMFRRPAAAAPAPVLDDVDAAASKLFTSAPQARPTPPPAPPVLTPPKSKLPLIAGGAAAAVLALGALMFMGGDKNKDAAKVAQAPSASSTTPSTPVAANTSADEARARQAEEAARKNAADDSRQAAQAAKAAEAEKKNQDDARRAEEAARMKAQDDTRRAEEAARKKVQDDARRAEEAAKKQAQDQARRVEEEKKKKEAAQRAEEDRKQKEAAKKKEAEEARKKAAESSPDGMLRKARETRKAGNLKEAIKLYTQAYNAGSGQAAKELGDYYHAAGPDQDADFAELWYGRARQKGIKTGK